MNKIIFCGNHAFSYEILKIINGEKRNKIILVITKNKNNNVILEINKFCEKNAIPLLKTNNINKNINEIKKFKHDIFFSCAFGNLFNSEFLKEFIVVNLHPSLLPKFRGASPIRSYFLNNYKNNDFTGITLFKTVSKLDAGPIYFFKSEKRNNFTSYNEVFIFLCKLAKENINYWINEIISNKNIVLLNQNNKLASYCYKFKGSYNKINFNNSAEEVIRFINTFKNKWKPFFNLNNMRIIIHDAYLYEYDNHFINQELNRILLPFDFYLNKNNFLIKCKKKFIFIKKLQVANSKSLNVNDFYNGYAKKIIKF